MQDKEGERVFRGSVCLRVYVLNTNPKSSQNFSFSKLVIHGRKGYLLVPGRVLELAQFSYFSPILSQWHHFQLRSPTLTQCSPIPRWSSDQSRRQQDVKLQQAHCPFRDCPYMWCKTLAQQEDHFTAGETPSYL